MTKAIQHRNGFTIVELIIAGAISVTVVGLGFSILQISLRGNKINEAQTGLSGRLNDTLDFILDEVKVGNRIIDTEDDIDKLNSNCTYPDSGDFLFGVRLPDQALVKDDYKQYGDDFILSQIDCPIVYTLRPSNTNELTPYTLVRYGPQYNEKGYYISPSYRDFKETVLLDGISSINEYEKISCPNDWKDIKTIKGISFCIDKFNKSIEIQIESDISYNNNTNLKSIASTGGFSSIQDERQVNLRQSYFQDNADSQICIGTSCCWMGVCLKSNKITYMIDSSYFMNSRYNLHPNGVINNGQWIEVNDPKYISPTINGKSLFDTAISSLKQKIYKLPTSDSVTGNKKVYLQIIAFNNSSEYLFEDGPKELTIDNKVKALNYLDNLSSEFLGIDPWDDICTALESDTVGQIILLSASIPRIQEGNCAGREGNFADIISDYNRITRSKTPAGALIIDSISLFHNFCEASKNYDNNKWLGLISSGDESMCTHIK